MYKWFLAGAGGFVGSSLRYLVGVWLLPAPGGGRFPWATLTVNIVGCLIIGLLSGLSERRGLLTAELRVLLVVGVLGGFTTFSSFGQETVVLWRAGAPALSAANVAANLVLGLGAVLAGIWLGRLL